MPDEFAAQRGELQRRGDPRTYGLPAPLPENIPLAPAPGYSRHVYSIFDARPLGGYDFAISTILSIDGTPGTVDFTFITPAGYVSFLKGVEISSATPVFLDPGVIFPLNEIGVEYRLLSDDTVIPNVRWLVTDDVLSQKFDTAVVYGPELLAGLRMTKLPSTDFIGFDETLAVVVRFYGTLILNTGEPYIEQVGSDETPVVRRLVDGFVRSPFGGLLLPAHLTQQEER